MDTTPSIGDRLQTVAGDNLGRIGTVTSVRPATCHLSWTDIAMSDAEGKYFDCLSHVEPLEGGNCLRYIYLRPCLVNFLLEECEGTDKVLRATLRTGRRLTRRTGSLPLLTLEQHMMLRDAVYEHERETGSKRLLHAFMRASRWPSHPLHPEHAALR